MSMGEVVLTLVVALLAFGRKQMPMVAHHMGQLFLRVHYYKRQIADLWQQQWNEHQLQENIKKARQAELSRQKDQ
jgi:sec-independent protein translocase protein TatB